MVAVSFRICEPPRVGQLCPKRVPRTINLRRRVGSTSSVLAPASAKLKTFFHIPTSVSSRRGLLFLLSPSIRRDSLRYNLAHDDSNDRTTPARLRRRGDPAQKLSPVARTADGRAPGDGPIAGTPELYFTDPDGIVVQLQHTSHCAGSGYLGEVCPNKPEPAPTRGVLALRDLNHVTLGVSNQQRSREFYRDLFGMKVQAYQGPSPVHAIGSGPQFMAFGAGSANGGIPRTPNIAHFCMTVDKFELDKIGRASCRERV